MRPRFPVRKKYPKTNKNATSGRAAAPHQPDGGVIFQTGAFDAVWDGQFDMEPTESARRAARDALGGWDPTGGCIYYYNPRTATNSWIWTRQVQLTIGQHAFAI